MTDNQQQYLKWIGSGRFYHAVRLDPEQGALLLSSEEIIQQAPICSLTRYCEDSWRFIQFYSSTCAPCARLD
jgi:hypothetical protein